jgi:hypothetical protein
MATIDEATTACTSLEDDIKTPSKMGAKKAWVDAPEKLPFSVGRESKSTKTI